MNKDCLRVTAGAVSMHADGPSADRSTPVVRNDRALILREFFTAVTIILVARASHSCRKIPVHREPKLTAAPEEKLDSAVVAGLYDEFGDELHRFLVGVLRDSQLASDAVQQAFVQMVEKGHATRAESRKAWLFRVAYNEAMALLRRQATGDKVYRRVAWVLPEADGPSDAPVVRKETVSLVRAAIDELPAAQRQVVRMRIYEEKTFAVISKELSIPLGTALGRMRQALAKLREKLGE